jgi:hypothetical protein
MHIGYPVRVPRLPRRMPALVCDFFPIPSHEGSHGLRRQRGEEKCVCVRCLRGARSRRWRLECTAVRPKSKPRSPYRTSADSQLPSSLHRPPWRASKSQSVVRTWDRAQRSDTPRQPAKHKRLCSNQPEKPVVGKWMCRSLGSPSFSWFILSTDRR